LAATLLAAVLGVAPHASAASRGVIEANALLGFPSGGTFAEGWSTGWGIGGALRWRIGTHVQIGVEADFMQFKFDGLEGLAPLGGERRFTRAAVPLRMALWEHKSAGRERLSLQVSGGWAWQSIEGTFGSADSELLSPAETDDGMAITGGLRFSRTLYGGTRWSAELRYTRIDLQLEDARHVALVLGIEMPLDGSRPHDSRPYGPRPH
jgi:hypothetical protein